MWSRPADLSTQAQIRTAATKLFGQGGADAVSIRSIAEAADVSPGSVIHHFGSKAGLIEACDDYLMDRLAQLLGDFAKQGDHTDTRSAMSALSNEPDLFAYLARTLTESSEAAARTFDRLFGLATSLVDDLQRTGKSRKLADPEATAIFFLCAELGQVVFRHHIQRLIDADPFAPDGADRLMGAELELMTTPLLNLDTKTNLVGDGSGS